jgi:hypothetical protein
MPRSACCLTVTGDLAIGDVKAATAKIEYLYADLRKLNCGTTLCVAGTDISYHANIVRGGLSYHFWWRAMVFANEEAPDESAGFFVCTGTSA